MLKKKQPVIETCQFNLNPWRSYGEDYPEGYLMAVKEQSTYQAQSTWIWEGKILPQ